MTSPEGIGIRSGDPACSAESPARRDFLAAAFLAAGGALLAPTLSQAGTSIASRFVFIILRGGLDGLAAVPPYGDPHYAGLRRELAIGAPGTQGGGLPLEGPFALHPSLRFLHESFAARELVVLHAVASPYRERSHFDAQNVLESGLARPHASQTGWLNRALAALPSEALSGEELGVALGQNVPLVMRGPAPVASWSPTQLEGPDEDTLQRIMDLYAADPLLSRRLVDALEADELAGEAQSGESMPAPGRQRRNRARGLAISQDVIRVAAGFLQRDDGPRVAVLDSNGWDTHANQGAAQGPLALRLAALDAGLRTLKEQLGATWRQTVVLAVTEFGRTAKENGTGGTDHGTANVAFLLGGAVAGGKVIADWPGLAERELHEGRDLKPTLDLRAVLKAVLADHLGVPTRALEESVFPDSADVRPLQGLLRA